MVCNINNQNDVVLIKPNLIILHTKNKKILILVYYFMSTKLIKKLNKLNLKIKHGQF